MNNNKDSKQSNLIELSLNSFKKKAYPIQHFLFESKIQKNQKHSSQIRKIIQSQEYEYFGQVSEQRSLYFCKKKINGKLVIVEIKEVTNKNKCIYLSMNLTVALKKEIRKYFMMKNWSISDKSLLHEDKMPNAIAIVQYDFVEMNLKGFLLKESKQNKKISQQTLFSIFKDIIQNLCYYHLESIAILDIRPETILFEDGKWFILNGDFATQSKTTEFGSSVSRPVGIRTFTCEYLSPLMYESYMKNNVSISHNPYKSDVYSIGLIIWQTLNIGIIDSEDFSEILSTRKAGWLNTITRFHIEVSPLIFSLNIRQKMQITQNQVYILPNFLKNMLSEVEQERKYIIQLCLGLNFTTELYSKFIVPFQLFFKKQSTELQGTANRKKIHFAQCGIEYEGEIIEKNDQLLKEGRGTITCNGSKVFEGEWQNNVPHGKCSINFGGSWLYEGQVAEGMLHGPGSLTFNGIRIGGVRRFYNLEQDEIINHPQLEQKGGYYLFVPVNPQRTQSNCKRGLTNNASNHLSAKRQIQQNPVSTNAGLTSSSKSTSQLQHRVFFSEFKNSNSNTDYNSFILNLTMVSPLSIKTLIPILLTEKLFLKDKIKKIKLYENVVYQRYNGGKFDMVQIEAMGQKCKRHENLETFNSFSNNSLSEQNQSFPLFKYTGSFNIDSTFIKVLVSINQGTNLLLCILRAIHSKQVSKQKAQKIKQNSSKDRSSSAQVTRSIPFSQSSQQTSFQLDLSATSVSDDTIREIMSTRCGFSQINISKCFKLSDHSVKYILASYDPQIGCLEALNLSFLHLTDRSLDQLRFAESTKSLKRLNLSNCTKLTNQKLALVLSDVCFTNIEHLQIAGLGITHHGLQKIIEFGRFKNIKSLDLGSCHKLSQAPMINLIQARHMRNLTKLQCQSTTIKDSFLQAFSNESIETPIIQHLNLSGCINFTMYGISKYFLSQKSKHIKCLNLSNLDLSDQFIELVGKKKLLSSQLSQLNLSACHKLTDKGLKELLKAQTLQELKFLDLSKTNASNDTIIVIALPSKRRIQWLKLNRCSKINDAGLQRLMASQSALSLKRLQISGTSVKSTFFDVLSAQKNHTCVQELSLSECELIIEANLITYLSSRKCSTLKLLNLASTKISKKSIIALSENPFLSLSHLHLKIDNCPNICQKDMISICIPHIFQYQIQRKYQIQRDSAADLAQNEILLKMIDLNIQKNYQDFPQILNSKYLINLENAKLKWLNCTDSLISMAKNKFISNLKVLSLQGCKFEEYAVIQLFRSSVVKNLEHIDLSWTEITNETLFVLSTSSYLNSIKHLNLSKCTSFNDKGICKFLLSSKCSLLQSLDMRSTLITNSTLQSLSKSKGIKHLSKLILKSCPNINELGFKQLFSGNNCSSLKQLDVGWTRVKGSLLSFLSKSKTLQLQTLKVTGLRGIQFQLMKFIHSPFIASLSQLDISYTEISSKILPELAQSQYMQNLDALELIDFKIDQSNLQQFRMFIQSSNFNKIRKLKLSSIKSEKVMDSVIQQMKKSMVKLESLFIIGASQAILKKYGNLLARCRIFSEDIA